MAAIAICQCLTYRAIGDPLLNGVNSYRNEFAPLVSNSVKSRSQFGRAISFMEENRKVTKGTGISLCKNGTGCTTHLNMVQLYDGFDGV